MYAIEARDLVKHFEEFEALRGVDLRVREGEVYGVIGPNGSGKSTLFRIITGVLKPDSGHIRVLGLDPFSERKELAKRIGVVFGGMSSLVPYAPFIDSLRYIASLYGITGRSFDSRVRELSGELETEGLLDKKPVNMSLGQRMRAELLTALIHDPELLVLDEPTTGLDIVARDLFLEKITSIASGGKTVLMISHNLEEVEKTCSRVSIMNRGKVVFEGKMGELRKRINYRRCRIVLERPFGGKKVIELRISNVSVHEVLRVFERYGVRDLEITPPPIEEVVAGFYR